MLSINTILLVYPLLLQIAMSFIATTFAAPPLEPQDLVVRPTIDVKNFSTLQISWTSNGSYSEWYVLEISLKHEDRKFLQVFKNLQCCDITYIHYSRRREVQFRLCSANEYGKSDYVESGLILLPNYRESYLNLTVVHDSGRLLYLLWEIKCEELFLGFRIYYRTLSYPPRWMIVEIAGHTRHAAIETIHNTEYILLLAGISKGKEQYSDLVYHRTKTLGQDVGNLTFYGITATEATVHFELPAHSVVRPMRYELHVHRRTPMTPPQKELLTSQNSGFPFTLRNLTKYEMYFVRVAYSEISNRSAVNSTEFFLFVTAQDIPGDVTNLSLLHQHVNPNGYVVFSLAWNSPQMRNGIVTGYRIRWKLKDSKYNIFMQEQCHNYYDLKVYNINEKYEVYISAKSFRVFGPENKMELFAKSSAGDCEKRSATSTE